MEQHLVTARTYYQVFAALLILTGLTVGVAFIDMGLWNHVLLLGIATAKALAVMLYFMHLRYSRRLTWIVAGGGFFWLLLFIILTMSDYLTRAWLPPLADGRSRDESLNVVLSSKEPADKGT